MIDFYTLTSPNAQKIYLMLEECEAAYREIFVDVWKGEQFAPEFVALNPNSKIPVIVDHGENGAEPFTVFESGAILMYLAEKHRVFLPADPSSRYEVLQWLMIQLTGVGPMFGQWVHFKLFAPTAGNDYALGRYTSEIRRLTGLLEQRLSHQPYLGGASYTIADIATYPWVRAVVQRGGLDLAQHPHLARWSGAIELRPAVQRALAKIDAIRSSRDSASDDDKDRFFGRGRYARV